MCGLVLYDENKKLIFQHRDKDKIWNPNAWGFFGGKKEKNETIEECLIRETKEELNHTLNDFKLIKTDIYENTECYFFISKIEESDKKKLRLLEGDDWGWFSIDEALKLDFGTVTDWNVEFLEEIKKLI